MTFAAPRADLGTLNADLHCHSTASDGTLAPERVAQRAADNGVAIWALTDHDELAGQAQAREAAGDLGMTYVTGTEVSVSFAGCTVHIVGLGFDPDNPDLIAGLHKTRSGRDLRAREMAAELAKVKASSQKGHVFFSMQKSMILLRSRALNFGEEKVLLSS